jgi:hypothetical protein
LKISCIKSVATQILHLPWYLFFAARNDTEITHKSIHGLGSRHRLENYKEIKKDTIWYLFGAKNLFLVSFFKTQDKAPSKNQIERISLSLKKTKITSHSRVSLDLCTSHTRHNCPNTAKPSSFSKGIILKILC